MKYSNFEYFLEVAYVVESADVHSSMDKVLHSRGTDFNVGPFRILVGGGHTSSLNTQLQQR